MTDILLFAAGLGTRMGALVADRPKPLVRVGGTTLIDHALRLTDIPEIGKRVVNAHYKSEKLTTHLAGKTVSISDETDLLRDTGGGLRHAFPLLNGDPVLTMNTDAVWSGPNPIKAILSAWRDDMDCLLLVVPRDNVRGHKGSGDFIVGTDGRLSRARGDIYSGLQMVRRTALHGIEDEVFSMNKVWDNAARKGALYGTRYAGQWCDVGQPDSIPLAESLLMDAPDV